MTFNHFLLGLLFVHCFLELFKFLFKQIGFIVGYCFLVFSSFFVIVNLFNFRCYFFWSVKEILFHGLNRFNLLGFDNLIGISPTQLLCWAADSSSPLKTSAARSSFPRASPPWGTGAFEASGVLLGFLRFVVGFAGFDVFCCGRIVNYLCVSCW